MVKNANKAYRVIHYKNAKHSAQTQSREDGIQHRVIFSAEKCAKFPSHKNRQIRLSNAKKSVKLDYFKRRNSPGPQAGRIKCDGGQIDNVIQIAAQKPLQRF
jgi:hypothetical protein